MIGVNDMDKIYMWLNILISIGAAYARHQNAILNDIYNTHVSILLFIFNRKWTNPCLTTSWPPRTTPTSRATN